MRDGLRQKSSAADSAVRREKNTDCLFQLVNDIPQRHTRYTQIKDFARLYIFAFGAVRSTAATQHSGKVNNQSSTRSKTTQHHGDFEDSRK